MKMHQKIASVVSLTTLATLAGATLPVNVYAEDVEAATGGCFEHGGVAYGDFAAARNSIEGDSGEITLTCDYEANAYYGITKNITFDLNGHSYTNAANRAFQVNNGNSLVIKDSVGGGKLTSTETAVDLYNGSKFTLESGDLYAGTWGVIVFGESEFIMDGGSVNATEANGIGVTGNGTTDPTSGTYGGKAKITLNAGKITSGNLGVYAPQAEGITTLGEGLTIEASVAGVEIRSGTLNIDGATITVGKDAPYVFNPNGSGSTASGVAIAVAQHTTTQPITANVTSGTFTAPVTFAEANPQNNDDESIAKVVASISGGTFNATNGDPIVASEDLTGFITGGTYNKLIAQDTDYVAEGYTVYQTATDAYVVDTLLPMPEVEDQVVLGIGQTKTIDFSSNKYIVATMSENDAATFRDNVITGVAAGEAEIAFGTTDMYHGAGGTINIYVYDVNTAVDSEEEASDTSTSLVVSAEELDEADLTTEDKEAVLKTLEEHAALELLGYFDVTVDLYNDGSLLVDNMAELSRPVEVKIPAPTDLPALAEGKIRNFFVIRVHNDTPAILPATLSEDGKELIFESSLFSTYALTYADIDDPNAEPEAPTTPDTGAFTREEVSEKATIATAVLFSSTFAMIALIALAFQIRKNEK